MQNMGIHNVKEDANMIDKKHTITSRIITDKRLTEYVQWLASREKAHEQLAAYLDAKNADTGYLLTFDFRKGKSRKSKPVWVNTGDKRIFSVVV